VNVSHLWAVDIATATAKCLYEFEDGEALGGMFIPGPTALDGAPAQPVDLSVDFPKGSMTGSVNFTVPATTFDGKPATGLVSYIVRANGELLAEGTAAYGSTVSAPAKITRADTYDITVTLSNSTGRSPKAKTKLWLGPDTPTPLDKPVLTYTDGAFNLSWAAPTEGEHGGYFDPALVTYTVTRRPGDVTVAENITATSLTEPMAVPTEIVTYSYTVTMSYDGTAMKPVSSNVWRLGTVSLPYHTDFEAENSLDLFTRIDCNNDHIEWYREWEFYVEETDELIPVVCYPYSSSQPADDWLINPPVQFNAGKTYTLAYESLTDYLGDAPLLAIYMGEAPTVDGMTTRLQEPTEITTLLPTRHTIDITVDHDAIYYIGFLACSEPNRSGIALTTIDIEGEDSGIDNVTADAADGTYTVYTIDGRIAAQSHGTPDTTVLPAGLYILKQGPTTRKLTLRH
ncbi:MAG: T9SS type A sorting domain-containing protein, partial [Muribaculaceae bacterium]|nr:T9SS type A sorting domain-containing protein [Muribaculaceae bacterium]